jgi:hypothetical protein
MFFQLEQPTFHPRCGRLQRFGKLRRGYRAGSHKQQRFQLCFQCEGGNQFGGFRHAIIGRFWWQFRCALVFADNAHKNA